MANDSDSLLAILDLGPANGKRAREVPCEIVRPLAAADIPALMAPPPPQVPKSKTQYLRHRHQQLAQLVARGVPEIEIAALTGYSVSWLSQTINHDQTFMALVAHYRSVGEIAFTDLIARMKNLGISAAEELQARIDEAPEGWSKRELMELMDRTGGILLKGQGLSAPAAAAAPVTVNLNFVKPPATPTPNPQPTTIDMEPLPHG